MTPKVLIADVGQGSCNIIVNGRFPGENKGTRAVVVDCGPVTPNTPLQLLTKYSVNWIDALIVSHNDQDHYGGLVKVLRAYRNRIGRIFFTGDRDISKNKAFGLIRDFYDERWIDIPPVQIALMDSDYRVFPDGAAEFSDDIDLQTKIFLISPTGYESSVAAVEEKPNAASAVVVLKYGSIRLVFPGDSTVEQWERIYARRSKQPLNVTVMVVPHHGGLIHNPQEPELLKRLFEEICPSEFAVISAGTNNRDKHPRMDVLEALYAAGSKVICTEKTPNCSSCTEATIKQSRVHQKPAEPSFSIHDSNKVACAGTIRIEVQHDDVRFLNCPHIHHDTWATNQKTNCPLQV